MAKVKYELQLRVISGVDLEKVFLLERSGSKIGRSPDAQIWIHDEHSPRKRCFIDWSSEEECFRLHVCPIQPKWFSTETYGRMASPIRSR